MRILALAWRKVYCTCACEVATGCVCVCATSVVRVVRSSPKVIPLSLSSPPPLSAMSCVIKAMQQQHETKSQSSKQPRQQQPKDA